MSATVERGSPPKIWIPRKLFDSGLVPDLLSISMRSPTMDLSFWC